jgi:mannose-6-phosphate isomerase-like protein (cupin superfamily)
VGDSRPPACYNFPEKIFRFFRRPDQKRLGPGATVILKFCMTGPHSQSATTIPADDPTRSFTFAQSDNLNLPHVGLAGDTYTILVTGKDTAGRYSLIDMHIPPGGGPPPHRHDFEEMFSVLEGEIEFTFRAKKIVVPPLTPAP